MAVDLKRKVGPLPMWAWIGMAAAVAAVVYLRARQSGGTATPSDPSASDPLTGTDLPSSLPVGDSGSGGLLTPTQPADPGSSGGTFTDIPGVTDYPLFVPDIPGVNLTPAPVSVGAVVATGAGAAEAIKPGKHAGHSKGHDYWLPGTGWVSRARYIAGRANPVKSRAKATAPGHHSGHSAGHDYYLPGAGWVSKARYTAGRPPAVKSDQRAPAHPHEQVHAPAPNHHVEAAAVTRFNAPATARPAVHAAPAPHAPGATPRPVAKPKAPAKIVKPAKRKR